MNKPKVQTEADDPPDQGANPDKNPHPGMPQGIPKGATEDEAKGTPNSDRQNTETVPAKSQPGKK